MAIALAPLFLTAEVAVECAALLFVGIDVLIDALVTDTRLAFEGQATGNLLRAPLLAQESFHLCPGGWLDAWLDALVLPRGGEFRGLFRAIATLSAVTLEFA